MSDHLKDVISENKALCRCICTQQITDANTFSTTMVCRVPAVVMRANGRGMPPG